MIVKIVFLIISLGTLVNIVCGQSSTPPPSGPISDDLAQRMAAERMARENRERQQQQQERLQMKAIADGIDPATGKLLREPKSSSPKTNPRLNEQDKLALSILSDDLKANAAFLKQSKTGIIRLHNADVCDPNDLLIQASSGCPNNVSGKATAFSFRTGDYRQPFLADIFFKGDRLSTSGIFTIGIYSDLSTADLVSFSPSSEGVSSLLDFEPPESEDEIDRQKSIMQRGIQVGSFIYGPSITVNIGNTYVLRSVAYNGKLLSGEKPKTINVLAGDERKDVTVVFKIIRQNSDGSIVLLWKELSRVAPPRIVLEAKRGKTPISSKKNEFTR